MIGPAELAISHQLSPSENFKHYDTSASIDKRRRSNFGTKRIRASFMITLSPFVSVIGTVPAPIATK